MINNPTSRSTLSQTNQIKSKLKFGEIILGRRKVGILHTIFIIQDLVLWIRKPWEKVLKFFCQVVPSIDYKQHKRHKVHNFAIRHQRKQFSFSSCQCWKKNSFFILSQKSGFADKRRKIDRYWQYKQKVSTAIC